MSDTIPDPGDNGLGFGFGQKDVKRISEAVRRVEAQYRNLPPGRRRSIGGGTSITPVLADSGAGFAVGSRSSPSSATVTQLVPDGAGPGLTTTGGSTVTCYSTFTTAIPASKTIAMIHFFGNWYACQVFECS